MFTDSLQYQVHCHGQVKRRCRFVEDTGQRRYGREVYVCYRQGTVSFQLMLDQGLHLPESGLRDGQLGEVANKYRKGLSYLNKQVTATIDTINVVCLGV